MCDMCGSAVHRARQGRPLARRRLIGSAAAFAALGTAASGAAMLGTAASARAQPVAAVATPDQALVRLMDGNARYAANQPGTRDNANGRSDRTLGQAPFASILGCSDSRVAPELAFDQGPGDLFVVRVAGNFVTPDGLASLEYGAAVLGTKLIMVLGHASCGAITAALKAMEKGNDYPGHIADLLRAIKPGIMHEPRTPAGDLLQRATAANVRYNVRRLQRATPLLAEMVTAKRLQVVGGVYDLATGKVALV